MNNQCIPVSVGFWDGMGWRVSLNYVTERQPFKGRFSETKEVFTTSDD